MVVGRAGERKRLAARWMERYRLAFDRDFPKETGEVEEPVGELLAAAPGSAELVAELMDMAIDEASRRRSGLPGLVGVLKALLFRRWALTQLVCESLGPRGRPRRGPGRPSTPRR